MVCRIVVFLWLVLLATSAGAQGTREQARSLGREGVALYNQGRWKEAHDKLREADRLHHAPTLVLYMARCQRNLGKLLGARDAFESIANESLPKNAPEQFRDAKETAVRELEVLRRQIPSVMVTVRDLPGAAVSIDGDAVKPEALARPIELDPGWHVVSAEAAGGAKAQANVTLEEGESAVPVELRPAAAQPAKPRKPKKSGDEGDDGASLLAPALVSFVLGAAGLAVGIATGVMARSKADEVKSRCNGEHCLERDAELANDAKTFAHVSTAGFVVAGVGIAAGVVLLLVPVGGDAKTALAVRPDGFEILGSF